MIQRKKRKVKLNDSLKIQLAQIYGQGRSKLTVKVYYIPQLNNGHDCGLFAISNMMEFATNRYKGLTEGKLEFEFLQSQMRKNLVKCFRQKYMKPFPKQRDNASPRKINIIFFYIDLLYCCSSSRCSKFRTMDCL